MSRFPLTNFVFMSLKALVEFMNADQSFFRGSETLNLGEGATLSMYGVFAWQVQRFMWRTQHFEQVISGYGVFLVADATL